MSNLRVMIEAAKNTTPDLDSIYLQSCSDMKIAHIASLTTRPSDALFTEFVKRLYKLEPNLLIESLFKNWGKLLILTGDKFY